MKTLRPEDWWKGDKRLLDRAPCEEDMTHNHKGLYLHRQDQTSEAGKRLLKLTQNLHAERIVGGYHQTEIVEEGEEPEAPEQGEV